MSSKIQKISRSSKRTKFSFQKYKRKKTAVPRPRFEGQELTWPTGNRFKVDYDSPNALFRELDRGWLSINAKEMNAYMPCFKGGLAAPLLESFSNVVHVKEDFWDKGAARLTSRFSSQTRLGWIGG